MHSLLITERLFENELLHSDNFRQILLEQVLKGFMKSSQQPLFAYKDNCLWSLGKW